VGGEKKKKKNNGPLQNVYDACPEM